MAAWVVAAYAALRRRQYIAASLTLIGLLLAAIVTRGNAAAAWVVPAYALVAIPGLVVFTAINWRCPACRRYMGRPGGSSKKRCGFCEAAFQ